MICNAFPESSVTDEFVIVNDDVAPYTLITGQKSAVPSFVNVASSAVVVSACVIAYGYGDFT